MPVATWITNHKALIGAVASTLVTVAPFVPPPYNAIPLGIAALLGGVVGGQLAVKSHLAQARSQP